MCMLERGEKHVTWVLYSLMSASKAAASLLLMAFSQEGFEL